MRRSWLDYVPICCYVFSALFCLLVAAGNAYAQAVPGNGGVVGIATTVTSGLSGTRTAFGQLLLGPSTWQPAEIRLVGDGLVTKVNSTLVSGAPVQVLGRIPKATYAAALGRFAAKNVPLLNFGVSLYDLAKELGFTATNVEGGVPSFTRVDSTVCSTAPCYEYAMLNFSTGQFQWTGFRTGESACAASVGNANAWSANYNFSMVDSSGYHCLMHAVSKTDSSSFWDNDYGNGKRSTAPVAAVSVASSAAEFGQAIADKTSWDSSSALPRAVAEAAKSGEVMPSPTENVTGPATSPGGSTVITDPVNNTTSTSTTTNNYSYAGDTVTTNQTTTNVTVNNTTGAVTTNTTTTTNPPAPEPPKVCGLPGTPACKMDESGTPPPVPPSQYDRTADDYKAKKDSNRETMGGTADKPFFSGWSVFFSAPAVVACEPVEMPNGIPPINGCGVVEGVRVVMGYLWAMAALYMCVGMVRRVS